MALGCNRNAGKRVLQWKKDNPKKFWTIVALLALTVITGGIAGAVTAAGFTSGGVLAGSAAAAWQAAIGNVVAGSLFAFLQSVTATGVIMLPVAVCGGALVAFCLAIGALRMAIIKAKFAEWAAKIHAIKEKVGEWARVTGAVVVATIRAKFTGWMRTAGWIKVQDPDKDE
ncbi:hypothetical protein DFH27DRAFT_193058 [Peziza echinospora]|nr:hypothetical protein DFH27DRAFT_193058 [Peziza echinospora]